MPACRILSLARTSRLAHRRRRDRGMPTRCVAASKPEHRPAASAARGCRARSPDARRRTSAPGAGREFPRSAAAASSPSREDAAAARRQPSPLRRRRARVDRSCAARRSAATLRGSTDSRSPASPPAPRRTLRPARPRPPRRRACAPRERRRACRSCGARPPRPCCAAHRASPGLTSTPQASSRLVAEQDVAVAEACASSSASAAGCRWMPSNSALPLPSTIGFTTIWNSSISSGLRQL